MSPSFSWGMFGKVLRLDQSHASKKICWIIILVMTLAQGSNFPGKGSKGGGGGMVKLRIDRRISICNRYLTVASRINFLGQVARSVEQWDKKRFLQGLHRSPCSTGIFQWKLLCQLVVLRRIFASNDSEVWILFQSLQCFPFFHRILVLTIPVWITEFVK